MKILISVFLVIYSCLGISQSEFAKNAITVETGFGDRGAFGLTYSRSIPYNAIWQFSVGVGAGVGIALGNGTWGIPTIDPSEHFYCKGEAWYGEGANKLVIGFQPKFVARRFGSFLFKGNTVSTAAYFGYQYLGDRSFIFQARLGLAYNFDLEKENISQFLPCLGFSFGKSF